MFNNDQIYLNRYELCLFLSWGFTASIFESIMNPVQFLTYMGNTPINKNSFSKVKVTQTKIIVHILLEYSGKSEN